MFNKLKFNNLVISNKKGLQQARIQTINKLVHKIRKLKTLFEKHPDNIKCKERIRKSTETMVLLKKLERMDIMKKILLMDKPAASIITNGLATPEEIAVALLSMNKVMQVLIKRFKTELEINNAKNDDWKQVLMESSKRKRKIERTEEKRKKRLESKQQKAIGRKRQEWLEENQANIKEENLSLEADVNISTIGDWQIEELSNDHKAEEDKEVIKKPKNEIKKQIKENKAVTKKPEPNKKQKTENGRKVKSAEHFSIEESKQLNGLNKIFKIPDTNKSEKSIDTEEESEISLVVDPFFITDTGENYLSTAIKKKISIAEEENTQKRDLHMIKLNNFGKKTFEFNDRRNQKRCSNWKSERSDGNDMLSRNQWKDKTSFQRKPQDSNYKNANDEKSLHPSWAAKQKLKPIITGFQGKKITFEDDFLQKNDRSENAVKSKKPASLKMNNTEKDLVHPSWAAKQKLKSSITTFQGKRITFDNDE